jgi:hypothetical protein
VIFQNLITDLIATLDTIVLPLLTILDAIRATSSTCFIATAARTRQIGSIRPASADARKPPACWKNTGPWSPC